MGWCLRGTKSVRLLVDEENRERGKGLAAGRDTEYRRDYVNGMANCNQSVSIIAMVGRLVTGQPCHPQSFFDFGCIHSFMVLLVSRSAIYMEAYPATYPHLIPSPKRGPWHCTLIKAICGENFRFIEAIVFPPYKPDFNFQKNLPAVPRGNHPHRRICDNRVALCSSFEIFVFGRRTDSFVRSHVFLVRLIDTE